MLSPYPSSEDKTAWLLAIGQRLRVEYDAVMEPMPPRLIVLLDELRTINGEAVHGVEEGKHTWGEPGDTGRPPSSSIPHPPSIKDDEASCGGQAKSSRRQLIPETKSGPVIGVSGREHDI